ncbi:glucosidase family protein [Flindersiella endophytica]
MTGNTYQVDDFAFDLRRLVPYAEPWVGSGRTTVLPRLDSVCGVGGFYGPPCAAGESSLDVEFSADGVVVVDRLRPRGGARGLLFAGGTWYPDRVVRHGTYHRYDDGRLSSFSVESTTTPLWSRAGYCLRIAVHNRGDRTLDLAIRPRLEGEARLVPLGEWGWVPPGGADAGEGASMSLVSGALTSRIPAGGGHTFTLGVVVGADPPDVAALAALAEEARDAWRTRAARSLERIPVLASDIDGLEEFYRGSLASGLVCLWDNPAFAVTPWVATSGLDGGALCAYAWDTGGYAPHVLTMLLGADTRRVAAALLATDLTKHYAVAPDGSGVGVGYAYSAWSITALAEAIACHEGISADLVTQLAEIWPLDDGLLDLGSQENLLEMRATGWEHVVASPNAERAWSFDTIARLAGLTGASVGADGLRTKAARIRELIRTELWSEDDGWFRAVHPGGHAEIVHSIQAYDALRAGACTPEMAEAMFARLGDFLGDYGVSSVGTSDRLHYELGDPDWSGGGAYIGEGPQLALTLWEQRRPELAWSVLRRHLWLGKQLPYFPQEQYCDRPVAPPAHKRRNVVAGLAGAEAILCGLAGLTPEPDGGLVVDPQPPGEGEIALTGLGFRGHQLDLELSASAARITLDGAEVYAGPPRAVRVLPGEA